MVAGNFHILLFVSLPISVVLVGVSVALAAGSLRENRVTLWSGIFVGVIASVFAASDVLRVMPGVGSAHQALLLAVVANFWAATMLYLACAIRLERRHRAASSDQAIAAIR